MEILIKIPDEDYEYLKTHNKHSLYSSILNGTPLPKGHGRLKDVDELYSSLEFPTQQFASTFKQVLDDAPTIIEKDKE